MNKQEAINRLHEILKPGDVLYTKVNHVSRSGMSRSISVYLMKENNPYCIDYLVAPVTENKIDQTNGGVKISGCGMDMGFALVYDLSYFLYPKGFKVEGTGRNGDASGYDKDGGYALKQRWF